MRVVFAGSADVSAQLLEALYLAPGVEIVGVVTQPDRPSGRHQRFTPCPCKVRATGLGLDAVTVTPEKINAPESIAHIASLKPDIMVVVAYGQFLGKKLLDLPPLGCVNIHYSLLPLLRGAAPVQWALANGFERTGVTAMLMDEGMDSGDVIDTFETQITAADTTATLFKRLNKMGVSLLLRVLPSLVLGMYRRVPQDHAAATFAPKLKKTDGRVDWAAQTAADIERRVRAFNPWPGCFTTYDTPGFRPRLLKITEARAVEGSPGLQPGQICARLPEGLVVQCAEGGLLLLDVIPEAHHATKGRGADFLHANPHFIPGAWLTSECEEEPDEPDKAEPK